MFHHIQGVFLSVSPTKQGNATYFCAGGAVLLSYIVYRMYANYTRERVAQRQVVKVQLKREQRLEELRKDLQRNGRKDRDQIGDIPLEDLLVKLKTGKVSPSEVLRVYQRRALAAHDRTNCLTDVVQEAIAQARELEEPGTRRGALYGIPVSIKDSVGMKGYANAKGVISFAGLLAKEDCVVIKVLKAQGAMPFARTNIPQLGMTYETSNGLYGLTTHPFDQTRTPGGSSGGEAALLASGGSILGLGTDIGGSIRIPCSHCGLCGLKPTASRISQKGSVFKGQILIRASWGPMGRDVESLAICMRALLVPMMFDLDRAVPPIPFEESIYRDTKALRIGYFESDGYVDNAPAMVRGLRIAKDVLQKQGHTIVQWTPPRPAFARTCYSTILTGDYGTTFAKLLGSDKVDPSMQCILHNMWMTRPRRMWQMFWAGDQRIRNILDGLPSVYEWWNLTATVVAYRQEFQDHWDEDNLDALLCSPFLMPAPKHDSVETAMYTYMTNGLYNLVDYPAGVVPVGKVNRKDITLCEGFQNGDFFQKSIHRSMTGAEGLPISVQCVTPQWQEERCLRLMKDIETGVNAAHIE